MSYAYERGASATIPIAWDEASGHADVWGIAIYQALAVFTAETVCPASQDVIQTDGYNLTDGGGYTNGDF